MKKTRLSHRILAMVLVILMTVQLLPLSAFAKFGDLQSWDPGVDLSTLKQEDAINWPIKIYDYLSDGMLFEWMDTNAGSTSDGHHTVTNKDSSGNTSINEHIAVPYAGGATAPLTEMGNDFTYDTRLNSYVTQGSSSYQLGYTAWSAGYATWENSWGSTNEVNSRDTFLDINEFDNIRSPYNMWKQQSRGDNYTMTKVDAVDYKTPMHAHITDGSKDTNKWMNLAYFQEAQSTNGRARYMVLVYRSQNIPQIGIHLSDGNYATTTVTGGGSYSSLWESAYISSWTNSTGWTYKVIDLKTLFNATYTTVNHAFITFWNSSGAAAIASNGYFDMTHVGFFASEAEAKNYGDACVRFDNNPGEYLRHNVVNDGTDMKYSVTTVTPTSRSSYLNNIFSLNYRWKAKDQDPKMYGSDEVSQQYTNVRYGMDFTTHSTINGWKTNAYTSDTFWTWSNGTTLSLKNTNNNVTRTESVSMSNIDVEQFTQSNGAQFVRLSNSGNSKILLSKFREDHQTVQEGYVPLTADVDYMVLVYRPNNMTAADQIGLWAQGYWDASSPNGEHKTANEWKFAGLTKEADWTTADNVKPIDIVSGSGWQYKLIPISETIKEADSNMSRIDRIANLGMYLPELTGDKSLDIAYVGYFMSSQFDQAHDFGTQAVKYMNSSATVTKPVDNANYGYGTSRRWYGGGNKSFGMLYSSGGGQYLPSGNSGGSPNSSATLGTYGYQFDTWMIGYRTNAQSGDSFNSARYNLVYNESTGKYEKVKYTANYTPTGTSTGHSKSAFQYNATGTTNFVYFLAATEEDTSWGSNDGNDTNGKDFDTTNVKFDGYQLLETITSGVMTAGLLEGSLQTVTVNGVNYRVPVYRQETVEYIAYNLLNGLRVPQRDSSGNYNTRFIKGTESTKYGGVDLNGDGVIGKIDYDGDSRNGNELDEASVDLATALRHELGIVLRVDRSVGLVDGGHDLTYRMGKYEDTLAKSRMLYGEFKDCRNAIDTAMDAAYYLLNNIFISNSYNQYQDDYDYLTLSSATVNALGHSGFAYVFDAGFTTGKTAGYGTTFTDDGNNQSAIDFDPYNAAGTGTGTISMEGVTGKTRFDYGKSDTSWTTRFPFLPVTDAEGDFAGQTNSYYFLDDAQRVYTEGSNTYKNRNFNYVIASNGEFIYREEDDLFFEFEGDDDVYLFINGQLVLDIGGAHSITSVYIDVNDYVNAAATALAPLVPYGYHKDMPIDQFDQWISGSTIQHLDKEFNPTGETSANNYTAAEKEAFKRQHRLNLSDGQICQFDFYYMERHGWGANMRIVTNMHITDPSLSVDKTAHQFGEEIEYGGVIDPTSSVEYNFALTNTGNQKLYNLSWRDDVLGITLDPTNGLTVGKNLDGLDMNGIYVMNSSGGYLQAKDLYAVVSGKDINGNNTEFRVTFDEVDDDGGQGALKRFLAKLESNDGTSSGYDDAEITNAGSGLWVGATVRFGGIYYMLTPKQTEAGIADNTVYLTATTKTEPAMVGNRTLRSDDSHRLYTNGFPIHYQWAGHEIFINLEHLLEEAKKEADRAGSQLSLYQQFFDRVTLSNLKTAPCDKFGRVGGDYSDFLTKRPEGDGYRGYYINYKKPGVYTFYLLMYMSNGKDNNGNTLNNNTTYNANQIGEGYYAILRSQVFVADMKDSTYVLDYGLSTESLDANGLLFKDDYLFGPNGLIRAKLMGITGRKDAEGNDLGEPSFKYPSKQSNPTKTGIYFTALDENRIYAPNGFFNANLAIPESGKEIAYDSNKGEYTLTGVGTMTLNAVLPTTTEWKMPYLYYWYDDGTTGPSWPGTPLKSLGAGKYQIDIPADVSNVIINNGSAALKTNDLKITPGLESTITVTVSGNNVVSAKIDTIMQQVKMHVKVPSDWGKVYLHHWHDNGESTVFPGDELTEMDDNGYYIINLHGDVSNLLIANGEGKQTGDLSVFAGKEAWIDVSGTKTGELTDDLGNVTTTYYSASVKYTLTEGFILRASVPASWSDTVYMYYWREDGSENAPWPGEPMDKGDLWYTCRTNVPADVSHIVINDGDHQTLNLTVTPGLETWVMVQNETKEHDGKQKFTAKIVYGSAGESAGLTFTPTEFLDQPNEMWMAITVHGTHANPSGLNSDINIHNEVQMYKKVTVLPATVVYYEDTFGAVEYNKQNTSSNNIFTHHGNGSGQLSQSVDPDQPYGQDSAYQDAANDLYSGGSLTEVGILDDQDTTVATFDFKGTGFEIVGRTNAADSASIMVRVYKKSAYTADAYTKYLDAAWDYLNAFTKYNDVFTSYAAAVAAYEKSAAAYTAAQEAYAQLVAAYESGEGYDEKLIAAKDAFKAYEKACEKYKTCAETYEKALQTYKNSTDAITVITNIGSCSYIIPEELTDPSTLFALGAAPTAPVAPEVMATMVEPVLPEEPFVTVSTVYTQFDHGNNGGAESINQVPVVRVEGLELLENDSYVVEVAGIPMFDFASPNKDGSFPVKESKLYIDGVRIFQPMGPTNPAYNDKENSAVVEELRDLIASGTVGVGVLDGNGLSVSTGTVTWTESLNDNDFDPVNKETFHSIQVGSTDDYLIQGPNNEVYMEGNATNSALVFYVKPVAGAKTHELQIAARALDYGRYYGAGSTALNVQLQYGVLTDNGYAWKNLVQLVSGTEQYYSIPYDECPVDTQGRYQIILRAINPQTNANAMVSYTSVKRNGLTIEKVDTVGEGSILYYENGMLVKPQYEMVVIPDSSFVTIDTHKFDDNELTITLDSDNFYFYITSTLGGVKNEFYAHEYPGPVTSATMWKYDGTTTRWYFDILNQSGSEVTFTIKQTDSEKLVVSYCIHTYDQGVITREPNCSISGIKTYTCTKCDHEKQEFLDTNEKHTYSGGICSYCGAKEPKFYMIGWINGADYGCNGDYTNMGEYLFVDGKLRVKFDQDSYVFLKADGNKAWYMTPSYATEDTATFYNTALNQELYKEKMYVRGGTEVIFTLTVNDDGTLTLHYEEPCVHDWGQGFVTWAPTCTEDGERTYTCSKCFEMKTGLIPATGHQYENGVCICGEIEMRTIYFQNTDGWENVYLYSWVKDSTGTTKWPGELMERVEGEANLYKATLPSYMQIIFNNGDKVQTDDMSIPSDADMFIWSDKVWVNHSGAVDYYLVGTINGVDYGIGDNRNNMGVYKFVDGKLIATFEEESFVMVKTTGNANWFAYRDISDEYAREEELYNTKYFVDARQMVKVPAGVELEFTLVVNDDYSVTLSVHSWGSVVTKEPNCTEEGQRTYTCILCNDSYHDPIPAKGHSFNAAGSCTVCGEVDTHIIYFHNTAGWEKVSIYAFTEGQGEFAGAWPGSLMNLVEGETDLYYYELPVTARSVIFNNGTVQTKNLTVPTDGRNKYTYLADVWTTLDEVVELPEIQHLYLNPGNEWPSDNAWFAACFFKGTSNTWAKMTDADGDGTFECVVPDGFTNVIFCRMNKADTETLDWSNKWNQTVDLTLDLTNNGNLFTITGPWDGENSQGATGVWSTYTPPACEHSYTSAVTTPADCTNPGVLTFTCSKCSDSYTEEIPANGHNYVKETTKLGTCITPTFYQHTCKDCGDSYRTYDSPTGHQFVDGTCSACGKVVSTEETKVYLKIVTDWEVDSEDVSIIFYEDQYKEYVYMTDDDADGIYECVVPLGVESLQIKVNTGAVYKYTNGMAIEHNRMYVMTGDSEGYWANLGDTTEPVVVDKVYLLPDSNWSSSDAWFAAWFPGAETWVTMTDNYGNGYYECQIPDGATAVIFVRMNPSATAPSWNDGEKWNQTVDLELNANMLFVIENPWNEASEWKATGYWTDYDATVAECQHSYAEEILTAATCTTSGEKRLSCSACGKSYTETINAFGHNFVGGICSGCGAAEPTEPVVLYLTPNSNWKTDNPWYSAYFFGNGETWVKMTDSNSDGIYEVEAPAGYPNVIFCRMNPSATDTGWGNVWNQTSDLTVPADDKVHYTVAEGAWSKGDGAWSALTTTTTLSLRATRSITRAMSAASEEQAVVLPETYISGDKDTAMNLSSIYAQMSSDLVFGEMDIFVEPEEKVNLNIDSAAPVLSDDIRLNFYVTIPENAENVYMSFAFNGHVFNVFESRQDEQGRTYFTFKGINPQTMGDSIKATLHATVKGEQYTDTVANYSMVKYCSNILEKTNDADLITLISDLLVYGAKTQLVQNYKTDKLVTEGLSLTPSTFPGLDESFNKLSQQGQSSKDVAFTAVSLKLSSKMTLCLTVKTDDPSAYTYHIRVAGEEKVYTGEDLVDAGNGKYYLYFDELKATCFDETITATICSGHETVGRILTYSVNTYVQKAYGTAEGAMRQLLEAIYNYGNSARTFANKQG